MLAAAAEGNPVNQKPEQQPKHSNSKGEGNSNSNGRNLAYSTVRLAQILAQQPQHP
ncbi:MULTISPECIES: hypothetical protein [unclassified Xanthomonas]|uniref:hypothetical protein n=1 Tax=Xanthomonas sp. LMG 8992 TaxID=1591157 RepID=UPI00161DB3E0|nr:hypothetical protein [Xanthomonas sp. LMG 8992]